LIFFVKRTAERLWKISWLSAECKMPKAVNAAFDFGDVSR
jgi:hypothetical protein